MSGCLIERVYIWSLMLALLYLTKTTAGGPIDPGTGRQQDDRNYYGLGGTLGHAFTTPSSTGPTASVLQSKMLRNLRQSHHFHVSPANGGTSATPTDDRDRQCGDRKSRRHNEHQLGDYRLYFI
uniref:Uncharacterized protein n=1 Tax=Anopheles atroparvus TaxID=41427 RepID=A0A182J1M7_ANOAO